MGGVLAPPGETVFERMQALRADDSLRRLLLREPCGRVAVHANLIVPSHLPDCVAGYIIMEPTEYPAMSGSNTICVNGRRELTGLALIAPGDEHNPSQRRTGVIARGGGEHVGLES